MKFTILGSTGFIGNALTLYLKSKGHEVETPARDTKTLSGKNLGHVIYAIGMTGNFREHPDAAIEAHVNVLQRLIQDAEFESWLYLSSARIYRGASSTTETAALSIYPDADTLYDLSKLLGESICLSHKNPTVRVARLSNVYGAGQSPHTFLGSILRDLKNTGKSTIGESEASSKDYISIDDVCKILEAIALKGQERIYNVASGTPITHKALAETTRSYGHKIDFAAQGRTNSAPLIDTTRIHTEFGTRPRDLINDLPLLLKQ